MNILVFKIVPMKRGYRFLRKFIRISDSLWLDNKRQNIYNKKSLREELDREK